MEETGATDDAGVRLAVGVDLDVSVKVGDAVEGLAAFVA